MYSDILLAVDFDRTLTAPDSSIPLRNLEAIRSFIAEGGAFTVNTGRSIPMAQPILEQVPLSAPLLIYNGSAAYDPVQKHLFSAHPIPLDPGKTIETAIAAFPDLLIEVQAMDAHYAFQQCSGWEQFSQGNGCAWKYTSPDQIPEPFLKFSLYIPPEGGNVASLFSATDEEVRRMDRAEQKLKELFGDSIEVFRAAPKIIDVSASGVSKNRSARELQKALGKKILVCVGDAHNDLAMLKGADYAFCPADGALSPLFSRVCPCSEGAVADVILQKLPEILKFEK